LRNANARANTLIKRSLNLLKAIKNKITVQNHIKGIVIKNSSLRKAIMGLNKIIVAPKYKI